ncbi:hypothetical protein HQ393_01730 [Chitinibacter bivalviorum]|uniref:Uncharacterized protein n=1 Tax=Chitinibacter bivalviorum TaxID=2739434 RepID=A0A7H9BHP6_9NEIS|nr:hypothetical protein [Chitinibacter bivalviorum]QLG87064.1 hypothetical protein HQ393_01730 [Chitinibacter bivalviorum]
MTTTILGGGTAQPEIYQNSGLTPQISRFLVSTALVLVAGQWVALPVAPPRTTPYSEAELAHFASVSPFPIEHLQAYDL